MCSATWTPSWTRRTRKSSSRILAPNALAVEALKCPVARSALVDDQFRNVEGAVRAGPAAQFFDLRDVQGNIPAIAARLRLGL